MSTAWKSAVDNYVSRLSPSQKAEFGMSTTLEEFLQTFSEAYQSHLVRKGLYQRVISGKKKYKAAQRIHDAVREALKQLKRFSGVVDVFAQINQGVGGAIWGPLKMVATVGVFLYKYFMPRMLIRQRYVGSMMSYSNILSGYFQQWEQISNE